VKTGVVDTGVFVAGIWWRNEPHRVLRAVALGMFQPVLTQPIFAEYVRAAWGLKQRERLSSDPAPWLEVFQTTALWVAPVALRERVCRDREDDKFIEAALSAACDLLIARDLDLTVLERPFGIAVLTPRAFLSRLSRAERRRLG
jgi:putative PIN family toxin of toxin-antitoxin system